MLLPSLLIICCLSTAATGENTATAAPGQVETTEKDCVPEVHIHLLVSDINYGTEPNWQSLKKVVHYFLDVVQKKQDYIQEKRKDRATSGYLKFAASVLVSSDLTTHKYHSKKNWTQNVINFGDARRVDDMKESFKPYLDHEREYGLDAPICFGLSKAKQGFANLSGEGKVKHKVVILINAYMSTTNGKKTDICTNKDQTIGAVEASSKLKGDDIIVAVAGMPVNANDQHAIGSAQLKMSTNSSFFMATYDKDSNFSETRMKLLTDRLFETICEATKYEGSIVEVNTQPTTTTTTTTTTEGPPYLLIFLPLAGGLLLAVVLVTVLGIYYYRRHNLMAGEGYIAPGVRSQAADVNMFEEPSPSEKGKKPKSLSGKVSFTKLKGESQRESIATAHTSQKDPIGPMKKP